MDIENRKTTLNDDASIYNRKTDSVSKEDLKKLPLKQKLLYFKDYYLAGLAGLIAAVVFIVYLLYTSVINPSKEILSVMFLTGAYVRDTEGLSGDIKEYLGVERDKDYVAISYYDLTDSQMNMAYMTIVGAGSADIIICPYSVFEAQARIGMLADLKELLPQETYDRLSGRMLTGRTVETSIDGTETTVGEELEYGIDISDSELCRQYVLCTEDRLVLCAFAAPMNLENTLKTIDYFTEE